MSKTLEDTVGMMVNTASYKIFIETFYSCNMFGCGMNIANKYKHEKSAV